MPLKTVLATLDGLDAAMAALYEEKDGKFILALDGIDEHPGTVALKNSVANIKRERDKARGDLTIANTKLGAIPEGFDPAEWQRLKDEEAARLADPDQKDVNKRISDAVAAERARNIAAQTNAVAAVKTELETEKKAHDGTKGELRSKLINDVLRTSLQAAGVTKPGLLDGAMLILERQIETVDEDGKTVVRMKAEFGGGEVPASVVTWVQGDVGKVYVDPASGSGAPGNQNKPRSNEENPWSPQHWNKTAQGLLSRSDRPKAERFAKAAGFASFDAAAAATKPIAKAA